MGFENRDYARTDDRSYSSPGSRMSMIGWIIVVNIAVFVVQCVWTRPVTMQDLYRRLPPGNQQPEKFTDLEDRDTGLRESVIQKWFALDRSAILKGQIWRLATYDLLHSTDGEMPWHLFFNMYLLYILGRKIVDVYSEREFLCMYIASAVASGAFYLMWGLITREDRPAIGASGAVSAVLVVYAMRWPNDVWTLFYVVPVTAKWMAILYAGFDAYPMLKQLGGHLDMSGVAHSAHIGGMLFGFLYGRHHWQLEPLFDRFRFSNPLKRRPQLRVVRDTDEPSHPELRPRRNEAQLQLRLDELLSKITEQGQASLTESERNELNEASRYFR